MERRDFLKASLIAGVSTALPRQVFAQSDTLKLGFLFPKSGPAAIFGPSSETIIKLGVSQINAAGGILGRQIEAFTGDAGGAPSDTVQAAQRMWRSNGIAALIGQHDSASRAAVIGSIHGQIPYIFTALSEGGFCQPGLYALGETPQQQLGPVIPYLAKTKGASKWYLIGNDYDWPRKSNDIAKPMIEASGGKIVGEEYLPFSVNNFDTTLSKIRDSGANAVFITLVGSASVGFNRAYASFGLDKQALRLGTLIEENTLAGIGAENSRNLFSSVGYFDALDTPGALAFRAPYYKTFGKDAPVLNTASEGLYEGLLFVKAVFGKAGSTDPKAFVAAAEGASYEGPRGQVTMKGRFVNSNVYLATAEGAAFKIIESFQNVAPGTVCTN
jgi:urea transport system substrate-binding protein